MTFTQVFSRMNYFIESWTLCIEEQFYLILPLFFLLVIWLVGREWIGAACIFVIGLSYLFRLKSGYYLHPGATFDSLFVGVLIARLDLSQNAGFEFVRKWPWVTLFIGVSVFCLAFALGGFELSQFQGLLSIGFGLMLVSALNPASLWAKFLGTRIFKIIALSSYSTYLTHVVAIRTSHPSKLVAGIVFIAASVMTFVLGWLVYRFIEKPPCV
jgi:peptidoglycan/LPS O-acetylase OafA/YrhL